MYKVINILLILSSFYAHNIRADLTPSSASTSYVNPLTDSTEQGSHTSSSSSVFPVNYNPIGQCNPPCLNNGTCRLDDGNGESYCVCTPDFKGVNCKEESEDALLTCEESTCKYGGMCTGTKKLPRCLCKEHIRGKRCERHDLVYGVDFKVYENGVEAIWHKDYEDTSSMQCTKNAKNICKLLHLAITRGRHAWLSSSFIDCNLKNYQKNSGVIITVNLVLDIALDMITNISTNIIEEQIVTGLQTLDRNLTELQTISMNELIGGKITGFKVYVIDPCVTGNHDCSMNAKCVSRPEGTYTCVCNAFTIDASMDANYPGRRCLYDGLIIFAFAIVGGLICTFTVLICGCRRTIWRRYRHGPESIDL
ncbi:unnamed protein product, partial [Trichobilharzia szidati]